MKFLGCAILFIALSANAGFWADDVEDFVQPNPEGRLYKEWERLRISLDGKVLNEAKSFGNVGSIGLGLKYRYVVQPAFVKTFHQRFDSYMLNVNGSISREIGLGLSIEGQVVFSRLFPTKLQAITAPIYFLNRFPLTSKLALEQLAPGDAVRLEIASDGSIGKGFAKSFTEAQLGLSIAYNKGSRFIADVYRMQDDRVRVRMIATRDTGSLSGNVSVDPTRKFDLGLGIINGILNRWIHCTPVSFGGSASLGDEHPADTMMVDYVFDLSKPEGARAYEQIMREVRKFKFELHLNFLRDPDRIAAELLRYVQAAEEQFLKDRDKRFEDRAVDRIFKGRSMTEFINASLSSDCLRIWRAETAAYHSTTAVRSYDRHDVVSDNLYVATSVGTQTDFLLNLYGEEGRLAANALFPAVKSKTKIIGDLDPAGLSDFIVAREMKDKAMRPKEVERLITDFRYQYPRFADLVDWSSLISEQNKVNAYARLTFVFHPESFDAIPKLTEAELDTRLHSYVTNHPRSEWLPVDFSSDNRESAIDRFGNDTRYIAHRLAVVLSSPSPLDRFKAFADLRQNRLFQQVGAGFVMSLMPQERVNDLVHITLQFGADDLTPISVENQAPGASSLYRALEYILATINDRSFDLRLQLDENGNPGPIRDEENRPRICAGCL
jgi:hypothetical protein